MSQKKILVVDDEKLIRWSLAQKLAQWNYEVIAAETAAEAINFFEAELPDLAILDVHLPDKKGTDLLAEIKKNWPGTPVIMITAYGTVDEAVIAMRKGAYDFITKPIDELKLQSAIHNALESASLKKEIAYYKEREQKRFEMSNIVAESEEMKEILKMTQTIAESETIIVLLQGESGTGKDLLAQLIHHLSRRRNGPFLAINCSAIPENLMESELFGYEKGAFTDAKQQKKGLVELASGGTLFLDEVSTLSFPLQAKLLRFLETQTFKRVGGLKDIEVDLRVIAATNQDLEKAVKQEKFRRDLFYRLNVCPISIPPLRERKEDILPLAEHFISQDSVKFRKHIHGMEEDAKRLFREYAWPGNVRELKNAVERAMIFEKEAHISKKHLPIGLQEPPSSLREKPFSPATHETVPLAEMERSLLIKALVRTKGNKSRAAEILGISRDTLRYRIKKWKIGAEDIILPG